MRKPKVTVDSERVVTAKFGKRKPTFAQVAEVANRHGLSNYLVSVYDSSNVYGWGVSEAPSWRAKFTRTERL